MDVIRRLAGQKTVILISHRLANVTGSDRIYMMQDGRVAESGTHRQLLERKGQYEKLYRTQMELEQYGKGQYGKEQYRKDQYGKEAAV